MSTVPQTGDLLEPGPLADGAPALDIGQTVLVEEVVAARRQLAELRAKRAEAVKLLTDADGALGRSQMRVLKAEDAWHAYIAARVESTIP